MRNTIKVPQITQELIQRAPEAPSKNQKGTTSGSLIRGQLMDEWNANFLLGFFEVLVEDAYDNRNCGRVFFSVFN